MQQLPNFYINTLADSLVGEWELKRGEDDSISDETSVSIGPNRYAEAVMRHMTFEELEKAYSHLHNESTFRTDQPDYRPTLDAMNFIQHAKALQVPNAILLKIDERGEGRSLRLDSAFQADRTVELAKVYDAPVLSIATLRETYPPKKGAILAHPDGHYMTFDPNALSIQCAVTVTTESFGDRDNGHVPHSGIVPAKNQNNNDPRIKPTDDQRATGQTMLNYCNAAVRFKQVQSTERRDMIAEDIEILTDRSDDTNTDHPELLLTLVDRATALKLEMNEHLEIKASYNRNVSRGVSR